MTTTTTTALSMLEDSQLGRYGVLVQDASKVMQIAETINFDSAESISDYGNSTGEASSEYSDQLLSEVKNRDFDQMGSQLTSILTLAQETNSQALTGNNGKFPLIARILRQIKGKRNHLMSVFDSSKEQIDKLLSETDSTRDRLRSRNEILGNMFDVVKQDYQKYGMYIVAGKIAIDAKRQEIAVLKANARNALDVQLAADQESRVTKLEMRVADFEALQQSSIQTLAKVRSIQSTNDVLVDKYKTIRDITIPSWKHQFLLELGMRETESAAQLATEIDDFTDDMLMRGADLLHKNAVTTAKSSQRAVISVKTLKHVDDMLLKTFQDVSRIQADGSRDRKLASAEIEQMQKNRALAYGVKSQQLQ